MNDFGLKKIELHMLHIFSLSDAPDALLLHFGSSHIFLRVLLVVSTYFSVADSSSDLAASSLSSSSNSSSYSSYCRFRLSCRCFNAFSSQTDSNGPKKNAAKGGTL